jgi:hypothetical protein
MSITGPKLLKFACALMLGFSVILGASSSVVGATSTQTQKNQTQKKKKKVQPPPPPPLPSGPTGPVQQIPLDSIAAVAPQVTFQNNQLTIVAPNSTLADILRAVRKQTGAEIEIPPAPERVVTHLGPGPARVVVAELLNGSRFNYVLLGSPADETMLTRVVLVAKSGPEVAPAPAGANPQPATAQANNAPQDPASDAEAEAAEENMNAEEAPQDQAAADADQSGNNGDQPTVKTPQQMLQEMQQRQMQLQQQQAGQAPVPGSGMPPHPPQEQ